VEVAWCLGRTAHPWSGSFHGAMGVVSGGAESMDPETGVRSCRAGAGLRAEAAIPSLGSGTPCF